MKIKNLYDRFWQYSLSKVQNLLPWCMPECILGSGSMGKLPQIVKLDGVKKVLIITTAGFVKRGSIKGLLIGLEKEGIHYAIYDKVKPDPTIDSIEKAVNIYGMEVCDGIIAVGGGSVMDCAKVVGARIAKPKKRIRQMVGLLKIRKKIPPLYAVPTTAGTGSETTVAAVVTDSTTHYKYAISDICLIPKYAILDPLLTCGLPQQMTATTGMDALTHAVEAFINKYNSKESRQYALDAVGLIFGNLTRAYDNGDDIQARDNMLKASFYAGVAFTRAYVGYVHAIAHAVGGLYGIPHGQANAVILPVVLEAYGTSIQHDLSILADAAGIVEKALELI